MTKGVCSPRRGDAGSLGYYHMLPQKKTSFNWSFKYFFRNFITIFASLYSFSADAWIPDLLFFVSSSRESSWSLPG